MTRPEHRSLRRERPRIPALDRSRGSGIRVGWPSCSHGPASIDPHTAHSIAVSLSHRPQNPLVALRGSAPRGASRNGPPAPHRLGKPSPCTSPISDVLRRHRGHCLAGSRTGGKLARHPPCGACLAFTRATKTATMSPFAGAICQQSGRLPSCPNRPGYPDRRTRERFLD